MLLSLYGLKNAASFFTYSLFTLTSLGIELFLLHETFCKFFFRILIREKANNNAKKDFDSCQKTAHTTDYFTVVDLVRVNFRVFVRLVNAIKCNLHANKWLPCRICYELCIEITPSKLGLDFTGHEN